MNGFLKFAGYFVFPVLGGLMLIGAYVQGDPAFLCLIPMIALLGSMFFIAAREISTREMNRISEESIFNRYITASDYHEVPNKAFKLEMTGRFETQPVNVRFNGENLPIVRMDQPDGIPDRYGFYYVGKGTRLILVDDGLDECYRLFSK